MIFVGNQRSGGADLARHLMKNDNERVVVHEIRGFAAGDLDGAFQESFAISRGTRCKQHLYSLSLNPPKDTDASPELFTDAVERAEKRLGLDGQPRAIVFHEKRGADGQIRRHAHAVWCRIDTEKMKAVQMSHDRPKLQSLARELYLEHGWQMPRGFVRHEERNPRNYSLAEWQQAKRAKKDPSKLKGVFQDCWAISDSQTSFANALREHGYILARGDRRGFVAIDHNGEAFSIRQYVGIPAKQVKERLSKPDNLPDTSTAHRGATKIVTNRLKELEAEQRQKAALAIQLAASKRKNALEAQKAATDRLQMQQSIRRAAEEKVRSARIRTGWRGLIDRITGKRKQIEAANRRAEEIAKLRDETERGELLSRQQQQRKAILSETHRKNSDRKIISREIRDDLARLEVAPPVPARDGGTELKGGDDMANYVSKQKQAVLKIRRKRKPTAERKGRRQGSHNIPGPRR